MNFIINKRISYAITGLSILCLLTLSNCKKGSGPTAEEINKGILTSGTWKIGSVVVDGVDQTALFTAMTLQFQASSYSSTNGDPVWPASGTWSFVDESALTVKRNDDVVITISTISESSLVLGLTWGKTTLGHGRQTSVSGHHVFTFTK